MENKFYERLIYLREEKGLTRKRLAEQLGVSVRLVSYWENNQRECDFNMLIKIADLLNVTIDFLLGREDY
jgi:transcriptional regulator with XRE-family HTH domain